MAVSKRLRYEVLRRDNHTCRYCGAAAPDVKLTVDHVVPVALGGSDEPSNLVTACGPCNSGKTSSSPDAPIVADVEADAMRWARARAVAAEMAAGDHFTESLYIEAVNNAWVRWTYQPSGEPVERPDDWKNSVRNFYRYGLPRDIAVSLVEETMVTKNVRSEWRYYCGKCWRRIEKMQEVAQAIADDEDEGEPFYRSSDDGVPF